MMQGPHGYSPVQQPQWALPSEASQHRMTSVKPHLKLFGTIWHMFFMFALTSYDMLRLSTWKAGPTKPRHLLRKDPIRKERHGETEWCQSSEHTRLGDLVNRCQPKTSVFPALLKSEPTVAQPQEPSLISNCASRAFFLRVV